MLLTYRYRLKDKSSRKFLNQQARAVNQVWNYCVNIQRETQSRWKAGTKAKWLSRFDLNRLTKGVSKDLGIHAQTVQAICHQFTIARDNKKHGTPRFRASQGSHKARGWIPFKTQSCQISGNSIIYLGKQHRWFGNKRRPLPEIVKGGSFVEDLRGRWWVCFHVDVPEDRLCGTAKVGIDLGLKTLAVCDNGWHIPNLTHYRKHEHKLRIAQRARKKKRIKAIHQKIKNCRHDYHHKITTQIVRQNNFIAIGDVNPTKLTKTRFAKSVLDAGWSGFRAMLAYKARLSGAEFKVIDERYTSQACSRCGALSGPKGIAGLGIRRWVCSECGASHKRDVNSAKLILKVGRYACHVGQSVMPLVEGSWLGRDHKMVVCVNRISTLQCK
jgi:IS605 OrfB family transposase